MGNRIVLLSPEKITEKLTNECKKLGANYEQYNWRYANDNNTSMTKWKKMFTLNNEFIEEINHKYNIDDPASHLLRLRLIWQIVPFGDIAKNLWQAYLLVCDSHDNNYTKNTCKICTRNHSYLNCQTYRKCTLCLRIGHASNRCVYYCGCGINHSKFDHICELCGTNGHTYNNCPNKCPCKKNHLPNKHRCVICSEYGHQEKNCNSTSKCKCLSVIPHIELHHICTICSNIGHIETNCNEKCVCGNEHYLTQHYCKEKEQLIEKIEKIEK